MHAFIKMFLAIAHAKLIFKVYVGRLNSIFKINIIKMAEEI
jgi:hypothetical protein